MSNSIYFVPLMNLPTIIVGPGEYLTRHGERVVIEKVIDGRGFNCVGHYKDCGTAERWHKTGRILATSETPNDIVEAL